MNERRSGTGPCEATLGQGSSGANPRPEQRRAFFQHEQVQKSRGREPWESPVGLLLLRAHGTHSLICVRVGSVLNLRVPEGRAT